MTGVSPVIFDDIFYLAQPVKLASLGQFLINQQHPHDGRSDQFPRLCQCCTTFICPNPSHQLLNSTHIPLCQNDLELQPFTGCFSLGVIKQLFCLSPGPFSLN